MKALLPLLGALFVAHQCGAAPAPTTIVTFDSAKVTAGEALPGSNVVVTVTFKIQPGYYLHTSRPTVARVTPTIVQVGVAGATRALPTSYAGPTQKTIPGNPQPVQVYESGLTVQIPVVIAPNAVFPIKLPGIIACGPVNEKTHVQNRPEQVRFEITIPRSVTPKAADPKKK